MEKIKIGIIICNRYVNCAGGKCFRAFQNREGAFAMYKGKEAEIAAYTTCMGCPGGNVEYAPEEMRKNGVTHVHFATGLLVGYPPCHRLEYFRKFITEKFGLEVIFGTHPIPEKYYTTHTNLKTWNSPFWQEAIQPTLCDEPTRINYN